MGHWVRMLLLIFQYSERFKSRNLEEKKEQFNDEIQTKSSFLWQLNAKNRWSWVRAIKEPTFHQKSVGSLVTTETISKNKGSLGDCSAENRGSYMGVPPPNIPPLMFF